MVPGDDQLTRGYASKLLKYTETRILREQNTMTFLRCFLENKEQLQTQTINFNDLKLPIDEKTLKMAFKVFSNAAEITLTLKPDNSPERYLFRSLGTFLRLEKLTLMLTDGACGKMLQLLCIRNLKIYNKAVSPKETIIFNVLAMTVEVNKLALRECQMTQRTMKQSSLSKLESLSLKNVRFHHKEHTFILDQICNFQLQKLKLVNTKHNKKQPPNDPRNIQTESYSDNMDSLITVYLEKLPHKKLQILHLSLPEEKIDLVPLMYKLNLSQLRIYINNVEKVNDLTELLNLNELQYKTPIQIYFYSEKSSPLYCEKEIAEMLAIYPSVNFKITNNPFNNFPEALERERKTTSIALYRKELYKAKYNVRASNLRQSIIIEPKTHTEYVHRINNHNLITQIPTEQKSNVPLDSSLNNTDDSFEKLLDSIDDLSNDSFNSNTFDSDMFYDLLEDLTNSIELSENQQMTATTKFNTQIACSSSSIITEKINQNAIDYTPIFKHSTPKCIKNQNSTDSEHGLSTPPCKKSNFSNPNQLPTINFTNKNQTEIHFSKTSTENHIYKLPIKQTTTYQLPSCLCNDIDTLKEFTDAFTNNFSPNNNKTFTNETKQFDHT